jgi:hypothetical protein
MAASFSCPSCLGELTDQELARSLRRRAAVHVCQSCGAPLPLAVARTLSWMLFGFAVSLIGIPGVLLIGWTGLLIGLAGGAATVFLLRPSLHHVRLRDDQGVPTAVIPRAWGEIRCIADTARGDPDRDLGAILRMLDKQRRQVAVARLTGADQALVATWMSRMEGGLQVRRVNTTVTTAMS